MARTHGSHPCNTGSTPISGAIFPKKFSQKTYDLRFFAWVIKTIDFLRD